MRYFGYSVLCFCNPVTNTPDPEKVDYRNKDSRPHTDPFNFQVG